MDSPAEPLTKSQGQETAVSFRLRRKREKAVFLIPNLLTTANLFCGYYAIVVSIRGDWDRAAYAIAIAALLDGFDGRVARLTKSQSAFGEQYDSMSDLVSFGISPAILMHQWALAPYGKLGWLASFFYVACAALRLARFNVLKQFTEKRYFQGCPSPIAACSVASAVIFYRSMGLAAEKSIYMLIVMFFLAALMISTVRYRSFKDLNFQSQTRFGFLLIAICILVLVVSSPDQVLFPMLVFYLGLGPVFETVRFFRKRDRKAQLKKISN